ncbi:MAG: NAD(P)H-dependent oxidoreductase subunit E [Pseudomonadota bacterium]
MQKPAAIQGNGSAQPVRLADVVIIDDEPSMLEGCRQVLTNEGIRTATAQDGASGLVVVRDMRPLVVLVDLKMPGLDGMQVLSAVREFDRTIVPIVISGYGTVDNAVESMRIGALDFLSKPFEPEQLLDAVRKGIELSQRRQGLRPEPATDTMASMEPDRVASRDDMLLQGLDALERYGPQGSTRDAFFKDLKTLDTELKRPFGQATGRTRCGETAEIVADLRKVDSIIARFNFDKSALLQILLDIQETFNWLPPHVIRWVERRLNVPLNRIMSIACFYDAFSLEPQGEHLVEVCMGTACHVRGAEKLLTQVSSAIGIAPGETDEERRFTLKAVHCMGCCALGPVLRVDQDHHSHPSNRTLRQLFGQKRTQEDA